MEAWTTIPVDIYTPLELLVGPKYHYFMFLELILILFSGFYVFSRLGFSWAHATAGAVLYFMSPWVTYFYFYFLLSHSFIANLPTFYFIFEWFRTEDKKYLLGAWAAVVFGMFGTKLEFWFYNTALYCFYCLASAGLFYKGKPAHTAKMLLLSFFALGGALLVHVWQLNILLRLMRYSGRASGGSLANLFSKEMYSNFFMSIFESRLWMMGLVGLLLYQAGKARVRWALALLAGALFLAAWVDIFPAFVKSPFAVGAGLGLVWSVVALGERDWRSHLKTAALFLLFVYYWGRPERGDLAEMETLRASPASFKVLLSALVWFGCSRFEKNKVVQYAWFAALFVLLMRKQGQILMAYLGGVIWIPTRDNYILDLSATVIALAGLARIDVAYTFKKIFPGREFSAPAGVLLAAILCVLILPVFSNLYRIHPQVSGTPPNFPYYRGIPAIRKVLRDEGQSPARRILFADSHRIWGNTWGYGASLFEMVNQVTMYTSLGPRNYINWSLYKKTGIVADKPWGGYTREYSLKTLNRLPKLNRFGMSLDDTFYRSLEAKPPLEKNALEFLGVNQIVRVEPITDSMVKSLNLKNVRKVGAPFTAALATPEPKGYDGVYFAELSNPLPRSFLAYGVTPENAGIFRAHLSPEIQPGVIVADTARFTYEPAEIEMYRPERVQVSYDAKETARLVLLDLDHPFWHARLDGKEVEIEPAFHLFRSVQVPAGPHVVEFYCEAPYFRWALLVSLMAFLAGPMVWFYSRSTRKETGCI
jgi:hypothetical protein